MFCQDGIPVSFIDKPDTLAAALAAWQGSSLLALDTEFVRTNSFYPKVGLVQMADHERCLLIDPLRVGELTVLADFLNKPDLTVIIHSCGEDLNLLNTSLGSLPTKIFDTQVAAAFLGHGMSLSYQALVRELMSVEVAKDETRSDWLKRPLSETQLHYAASDVTHLPGMHGKLASQLKQKQLLAWFEEDCRRLRELALQAEDPANWSRLHVNISNAWRLNDEGLKYLQRLCVWRENKARKRNKPRGWIAKDNDLLSLANSLARSQQPNLQALQRAELTDRKLLERNRDELLEAMLSEDSGLDPVDRSGLNPPLSPAQRHTLQALRKAVDKQAQRLGIAPELLARKKVLVELLSAYTKQGELSWAGELNGWRREILQDDFHAVLKGESA